MCLESSRVTDKDLFAKVVNGYRSLITFAESSFLDAWLSSGYIGFFVHPWCDRDPGFVSPEILLEKVSELKKIDFTGNLFARKGSVWVQIKLQRHRKW